MKLGNTLIWLLLALLMATPARAEPRPSFDYYLMSLSWSPEFCDSHPQERQCSLDYGLVLHGLWPQFVNGYPQFCDSRPLSGELVKKYADLYPSENLIFHEWKKHGTCSGLAPADYLRLSDTLKRRFNTPPALQRLAKPLRTDVGRLTQIVVEANPGLAADAVALSCKGKQRFLQEIYVCFDKNGTNPVACAQDVRKTSRKSCGQAAITIRNMR